MRHTIIAHYLREHRDELPTDAKGVRTHIAHIAKDAGFTLPNSEIKRLVKEFEKTPMQTDTGPPAGQTNEALK